MKKFLICIIGLICCIGTSNAAVRDGTAVSRTNSNVRQTQMRTSTTPRRTTATQSKRALSARTTSNNVINRAATNQPTKSKSATSDIPTHTKATRTPMTTARLMSRAATNTESSAMTKTGAEYEHCKTTYFACMDQFCPLKNDSYRRCSCNDRVFDLNEARKTIEEAGERLNAFNEDLQVVGMTAAQATSIRTASEGEDALTADKSASKALLQAIMNSIRGEDANVSGKYTDLNSVNMSFDTSGSFDSIGSGQIIANYNGLALYNAVYPQCRQAVQADCNSASLQRAVNAYLMAIEQDCNTVQTAIDNTKKQVKTAIREGSAMLDLARVENRQKHNSSDIPTCINDVETAILSEEVCGANYHKCLDNGEFIDIETGAPIAGIKDFFKLEQSLVFAHGIDAVHQKLAQNPSNRTFVENFTKRTKKFAEPALDKCVENADLVWSEYLDKAMLSIYYAQKEKVSEIKQNCFNYISECYMNNNSSLDAAQSNLSDDTKISLQPETITLNSEMCSEQIESCNNLFGNNIIQDYIDERDDTDTITACRAVVKQCFDKYGGKNYENFINPNSGLFEFSQALDWFTLYDYKKVSYQTPTTNKNVYVSQCAQQLKEIDSCNSPEIIEKVFGGLDRFIVSNFQENSSIKSDEPTPSISNKCLDKTSKFDYYVCMNQQPMYKYGLLADDTKFKHRQTRPTGVATEIYYQIIMYLTNQCTAKQGRFLEIQSADYFTAYLYRMNACAWTRTSFGATSSHGLAWLENICPAKYQEMVDTSSWGICSCWHNGGRRSRWGTTESCLPILPVGFPMPIVRNPSSNDNKCYDIDGNEADCNNNQDNLNLDSSYNYTGYTYIKNNAASGSDPDHSLAWYRVKDIKLNDIACSKILDAIPTDLVHEGTQISEAWRKTPIKERISSYYTITTPCKTFEDGFTPTLDYSCDETNIALCKCAARNSCKTYTEDGSSCTEYKKSTITFLPFANDPNNPADPGARIISSYDKSGVSDVWCTQDQMSIYDQVCSTTGVNNDGRCNPVKIRQDDQYKGAKTVKYHTNTNTNENDPWNNNSIDVNNIVPYGHAATTTN